MALGKNTTLAYILSCFELGHKIYIHNLPKSGKTFPSQIRESVAAFHLDEKSALKLATAFRQKNRQIKNLKDTNKYEELAHLTNQKVGDILGFDCAANLFLPLIEVDFILQRLEPMKSPFPPEGAENIVKTLATIKKIFPNHIFNCPITEKFEELKDKETPQEINHILKKEIATPTAEFRLYDADFSDAINLMSTKYHEIFGNQNDCKIVIKPKNSAQSLGVFALQFSASGLDLEKLNSCKILDLAAAQIYKIKNDLTPQKLKKIVTILCYIQRIKTKKISGEKLVSDLLEAEIAKGAEELYNEEILTQPFLEGIKDGDIRANILKNAAGNFYCAGYTFRGSSRQEISDDFTTCYTAGGSTSKPISLLSKTERISLLKQCQLVIDILNSNLKERYKNAIELGADFILVGDKKSVMLGEINHHCPALIPISEAMGEENYDEGLGFTKRAVRDAIFC